MFFNIVSLRYSNRKVIILWKCRNKIFFWYLVFGIYFEWLLIMSLSDGYVSLWTSPIPKNESLLSPSFFFSSWISIAWNDVTSKGSLSILFQRRVWLVVIYHKKVCTILNIINHHYNWMAWRIISWMSSFFSMFSEGFSDVIWFKCV